MLLWRWIQSKKYRKHELREPFERGVEVLNILLLRIVLSHGLLAKLYRDHESFTAAKRCDLSYSLDKTVEFHHV